MKRTTKQGPDESGPDGDYRPVLNMDAGILTSERCPLGLPRWQSSPNGGYHHSDAREFAFAMRCLRHEFNLPEFDLWLSNLELPASRDVLLKARKLAMGAMRANNNVEFLLCLEQMRKGWHWLPLAQSVNNLKQAQRQPRGSRKPKTDQWITAQLTKELTVSDKALWRRLPSEASGEDVYSDGVKAFELGGDGRPKGKPMQEAGFNSRVTEARKRQKNDVSK